MEYNRYFEVNLNFISCNEHLSQSEEVYQMEYEPLVILMLNNEGLFLFEEELLERYNDLTLEKILEDNVNYKRGPNFPNPKKNDKRCQVYYDTWMNLDIGPQRLCYDNFFAYLLKHTDLMQMDDCLSYQFEKYHESNLPYFSRFLTLLIRKFRDKILQPEKVVTIQEWISFKEQQEKARHEEKNDKDRLNGKPKIRRKPNDNETILSQAQTVLLVHYMQEKGIFLKNYLLTDADAGKAFEVLTGYSQHTLRQDLGQYKDFQNKENLKKVQQALNSISTLIDNQLSGKASFL